MERLDLPELLRACDRLVNGDLDRDQLQGLLADRVMSTVLELNEEGESTPATDSQVLAYSIVERICATRRHDEDFELFVRRVVTCIDQIPDPREACDLLPLIVHHDEFSVLVSKYQRGIISQTGIGSIIHKRFTWNQHRRWLENASVESLIQVCELVEADDYVGVRRLIEWQ